MFEELLFIVLYFFVKIKRHFKPFLIKLSLQKNKKKKTLIKVQ